MGYLFVRGYLLDEAAALLDNQDLFPSQSFYPLFGKKSGTIGSVETTAVSEQKAVSSRKIGSWRG